MGTDMDPVVGMIGKETDSGFFHNVRFLTESFCPTGFE